MAIVEPSAGAKLLLQARISTSEWVFEANYPHCQALDVCNTFSSHQRWAQWWRHWQDSERRTIISTSGSPFTHYVTMIIKNLLNILFRTTLARKLRWLPNKNSDKSIPFTSPESVHVILILTIVNCENLIIKFAYHNLICKTGFAF